MAKKRKLNKSDDLPDELMEKVSGGVSLTDKGYSGDEIMDMQLGYIARNKYASPAERDKANWEYAKTANQETAVKNTGKLLARNKSTGSYEKIVFNTANLGNYDIPKYLCTVVAMHGYISRDVLAADLQNAYCYHYYTRKGYAWWARPLAEWANERPWAVRLLSFPLKCWAHRMAARSGMKIDGHSFAQKTFGVLLEGVCVPLCFCLGWLRAKLGTLNTTIEV